MSEKGNPMMRMNETVGTRTAMIVFAPILLLWPARSQDRPLHAPHTSGHELPLQAYEDCKGKKAGDTVQHTTPEGKVAATCMDSPNGVVARPNQPPDAKPNSKSTQPPPQETSPHNNAAGYSIEQATSDRAQLHTIAFDGLAFLTGDFESDTFLPPGKVSDYFGFQYMRDIDAAEGGHNTSFLTRIADNVLSILSDEQKMQLFTLAEQQQSDIERFAQMRFPLIRAFRKNLSGDIPTGSKGLNRKAVIAYSADLYALDGKLAFQRARVMGSVLRRLNDQQKVALAALKFGDSRSWPEVPEQLDRRSMPHEVDVAMMTYASEMFAWYSGSLQADTYFCPERHGMYFGGFGMKTLPAMGKQNYSISTSLTGESGEAFLDVLTDTQRKHITVLLDLQRQDLAEIVATRKLIASELRRFLSGDTANEEWVLSLSRRYGELDGEMSYLYATAFAEVNRTLTTAQMKTLAAMRTHDPADARGPFLYSTPINRPQIENTGFLFRER
jgi:hypothetical protein